MQRPPRTEASEKAAPDTARQRADVTAAPGVEAAAPTAPGKTPRRNWLVAAGFLLPALFFLGVWLVHPAIRTIIRLLRPQR